MNRPALSVYALILPHYGEKSLRKSLLIV